MIVNLQRTPLDNYAKLIIHAKIDEMMELLMKKLNIEIPRFTLNKWADIELEETKSGREIVHVSGLDTTGRPFDLFRHVQINSQKGSRVVLSELDIMSPDVNIWLTFQGHYNENTLGVTISKELLRSFKNNIRINMIGDPFSGTGNNLVGKWEVVVAHDFSMNNVVDAVKFTQKPAQPLESQVIRASQNASSPKRINQIGPKAGGKATG